MLRWYLASLIFLLIISPGIGFGVYQYVMHHPAAPGSFVGRAYERTVKAKLLVLCTKSMASYVQVGKTNTEQQTSAACKCFTDDMFEKLQDVPPGELDKMVEQNATQHSAASIFKACSDRFGLN